MCAPLYPQLAEQLRVFLRARAVLKAEVPRIYSELHPFLIPLRDTEASSGDAPAGNHPHRASNSTHTTRLDPCLPRLEELLIRTAGLTQRATAQRVLCSDSFPATTVQRTTNQRDETRGLFPLILGFRKNGLLTRLVEHALRRLPSTA